MTAYQSALAKLNAATTGAEIEQIERAIDRVYNAGQLTERELGRLCVRALERLAIVEPL